VTSKWLLSALLALPAAAGCKQGIGERCQVNSDCTSGVCSSSDPKICQASGSGSNEEQIDAELPKDAAPPDAPDASDASGDAADAAP
jgi:hypothetical protein